MIRSRRTKTKRFAMPEVTLTPLIDTFAILLIIFIVAAPMVQHAIKLNLPHGASKEVGGQQDLVVTMSKEGKLFFNSAHIDRKNLASSVRKAVGKHDEVPVYVQADRDISYGKVIEIVDELKQAGIKYVAMATQSGN